jgi:predicted DNA-binding protein (MmcQ/YjbR family)
MDLDQLREYCLSFPGANEDIKWEKDLCFCVGEKMFCVTDVDGVGNLSFKCTPEKFAELVEMDGIIPAPYVARYHWVAIERTDILPQAELKRLIAESYKLVFDKLPKRLRETIDALALA